MLEDTQQQKQYKVLIIGESCKDVYVFGEINRISPEAPVPVLKKNRKEFKEGMSGNVYRNIRSIVDDSIQITFISNDKEKIKKIRFIDEKSNYQIMRYDIEKEIEPVTVDKINDKYDVIVISDYNKGFISNRFVKDLISSSKDSKIFVDTKKRDISSFKNCTIKINENERKTIENKDKSAKIITTLGSKGCEYEGNIISTTSVDVYDVCGAGDVFLAALVSRWIETRDMLKSLKTANNCAALSVTKLGCYTLKREEYENLCV